MHSLQFISGAYFLALFASVNGNIAANATEAKKPHPTDESGYNSVKNWFLPLF